MSTIAFATRAARAAVMFSILAWIPGSLIVPAAAAELLMIEQPGCPYCVRWDREVAPAYASSEEGKLAPLRRVNLRKGLPADIRFTAPVRFTPTFVLVDNGREKGRITGYIDNSMFWGLLTKLLNSKSMGIR